MNYDDESPARPETLRQRYLGRSMEADERLSRLMFWHASGVCNPHCKNACWRNRHLGVWQAALDDVEKLSKKNRLSPPSSARF